MKKTILSIIAIIILTTIGYFIYIYQGTNIIDNKQDTQKQNSKTEIVKETEKKETKKEIQKEENFWEKNDCQVEQFEPLIKEKMVLNYQNNIDNIDGMVYEEFEYQGIKYILAQIGCADYTEKIFIGKKVQEPTYNIIISYLENLAKVVKNDDFKGIIKLVKRLKEEGIKLEKNLKLYPHCENICNEYLFISENEVGGIKYFVIGYNMTL